MAKYLQLNIIRGETTCEETLNKPRPHDAEREKKLNQMKNK